MTNAKPLSSLSRTLFALLASVLLALIILALSATSAPSGRQAGFFEMVSQFFVTPFSNRYVAGNLIADSVPLMIAGLGILIAFSSRNFNLGGEGQIYSGALAAVSVALAIQEHASPAAVWILGAGAGLLTGAILGGFSGMLKAVWRISEMIASFLLSAIAIAVTDFLVAGPLQDPNSNFQTTREIAPRLLLPGILQPSKLDVSLFVALLLIAAAGFAGKRSRIGFELRICGENEEFARYCGIRVPAYQAGAMAVSGALHGLAGALLVIGSQGRLIRGFSGGLGWSAITVALLAQNSEAGIIPAALFIAFLKSGSDQIMIGSGLPSEIAALLQAAIMLVITMQTIPLVRRMKNKPAGAVQKRGSP